MKKSRLLDLTIACTLVCSFISMYPQHASAALVNGSVLSFVPAPGSPSSSQPANGTGSWFAIEPSAFSTYVSLTSFDGVIVGSTQPASGSHPGAPDGSESPSIDQPHDWFGGTGMFGSESATSILSASANTATLDFSGLVWDWNGVNDIHMYDATFGDAGIATLTCGVNCSNGDRYILDYAGHIRSGDGGLGGELVLLHLEGTISAVPIPAAVWLFGSGLLGLIGFVRPKNAA